MMKAFEDFKNLSPKAPLRLLHLSDLHLCPEYGGEKQKAGLLEILNRPHDLIVYSGDMIEYDNYQDMDWLFQYKTNFVFVPGNHDVWPRPELTNKGDLQKHFEWQLNYPKSFNLLPGLQMILINSTIENPPNHESTGMGLLDPATVEFLKSYGKNQIWVMHHWPFTWNLKRDTNPVKVLDMNLQNLDAVHDLILTLEPLMILCGHAHDYFGVQNLGKTKVINSASKARKRLLKWHEIEIANVTPPPFGSSNTFNSFSLKIQGLSLEF